MLLPDIREYEAAHCDNADTMKKLTRNRFESRLAHLSNLNQLSYLAGCSEVPQSLHQNSLIVLEYRQRLRVSIMSSSL
jgi:hypothetical protein